MLDVIADISGILSLLFTIGKLFVEFFCRKFLEVETISRIFQFKFTSASKKKLKQNKKTIKIQNNIFNESSNRGIKNSLIDNISIKSKIMSNKNTKNNTNCIGINSHNNVLSLINNNLSKKISIDGISNISSKKSSIKRDISQN